MIYRSNLRCPDLTLHFKHLHVREMPHSMGHDVASDWADKPEDDPLFGLYKQCGLLTHDEAAILWNIAARIGGPAIDIGCHTGWSTAHMALTQDLTAIDPMLRYQGFSDRFEENINHFWAYIRESNCLPSVEFLSLHRSDQCRWALAMIDGDHSEGAPLADATALLPHMLPDAVIMFHDGIGRPTREGVRYLMDQGFHCRVYWTPHIVFCCWRGKFTPPDHVGDPRIDWVPHIAEMSRDFDFSRCE